jgi:FKBP-type peptidyl-prolyl cis-trans isomerase FkpA
MRLFNILFVLFLFSACTGNSQEKKKQDEINEQLERMNKAHVGQESKKIDAFVAEKKFNVQRTGTGLRYEIYHHGTGTKPETHNVIELKYKVYLLNGQLCYSSDSTGNTKFRIGEGQQIRGLEEGIMLMQQGDKARLILPNHLAFGMLGDDKKIPPGQPVYFDIELISIKK